MEAQRDQNRITTLIGVSSVDFLTPTTIAVNPSTHAVLIEGGGGGGGGTQYTDGSATPAHPTGTMPVFDNAGTVTAVSAANPLPVTTTVSTVGLATSAKQDTGNTSLANIDTSTAAVNTVIGAKTDAKSTATDATSVSIMQVLKQISAMVQSPASTPVTGTFWQATQPVSLASVPSHAVTNAGTFAVQATEADGANTTLGSKADAKSTATDTTAITIMQVLKQISASVQAPPSQAVTNAGTFAAQATLQTQTDTVMVGGVNIKEINAVTPLMGNGTTGTGSQRVTVASDNTPFPIKVDQTTPGTTNAVSIAQIGATTIVNGGTPGSQSVGGIVANNGTINSAVNPLLVGGQAVSSENAANTTAKLSQFVTDLVGKLIVLPYANPENFVSGAITSAMTSTTSTSLIAAPASGLRNYITQITVSNSHATVGTDVIIQDGSGGTTLYTIPAASLYGGGALTFPTPLRQPTTATAIYCANVTTGASTKVSASGYKGI